MSITYPITIASLPLAIELPEATRKQWASNICDALHHITTTSEQILDIETIYEEFSVSNVYDVRFNNARGLAFALRYMPSSALTAPQLFALIISLIPDDGKQHLKTLERLHENLTSFSEQFATLSHDALTLANSIRPQRQKTVGRVTDYVSPEALTMYNKMQASCRLTTGVYRRYMCKEWRDDYKAFERWFLENNMRPSTPPETPLGQRRFVTNKEGIICRRLNDPESHLHGSFVYGPSTCLFVSKDVQNFYNRTKRDFTKKLTQMHRDAFITEEEYLFMKLRDM